MNKVIDMTTASGGDEVRIMTLQSHILAEQDPHTHAGGTFSWIMSALSISAKIISDKVRRARLENVLGSVAQRTSRAKCSRNSMCSRTTY